MTASRLGDLLAPFRGKRAWLLPLSDEQGHTFANNGDLLMHAAFFELARQHGVQFVESSHDADIIAIPPNGALLDRFRAPSIVRDRLKPHGDKPVVVFPSSAQFLNSDPSELFRNRSAPTLWILREPYSYHHLSDQWGDTLREAGVALALDHDVVISGAEYVPKYFPSDKLSHLYGPSLLVARLGVESKDIRNSTQIVESYEDRAGSPLKRSAVAASRSLPAPLVRPLRRISTFRRINDANSELLSALPRSIQSRFDRKTQVSATDISDTSLASFSEYRRRIAAAQLVVTNRLHVAIPAALLGKETYLIDSGYHKLRGIYEHSLKGMDNITFVTRS